MYICKKKKKYGKVIPHVCENSVPFHSYLRFPKLLRYFQKTLGAELVRNLRKLLKLTEMSFLKFTINKRLFILEYFCRSQKSSYVLRFVIGFSPNNY